MAKKNKSPLYKAQRVTAVVLLVSGLLFGAIGILAVWGAFEDGQVVTRSLVTLAIIALTALVVNLAVKIFEDKVN